MMKLYKIAAGFAAVALLSLASCIDDNGNYSYEPAEGFYPAEITSGIDGAGYTVSAGEELVITPAYEGEVDESGYDYLWYMDINDKSDTLGHERKLEHVFTLRPAEYPLHLKVTNREYGISRVYTTSVTVVTEFSNGWFITKELEDGTTDLDMITYSGDIHLVDIISNFNGSPIPGKPIKTIYVGLNASAGGYEYVDSTAQTSIESMFITATSSDVWSFRGSDMTTHYMTDRQFFDVPANIDPYDLGCYNHMMSHFTIFINDGSFHWLAGKNGIGTAGHGGAFSDRLFPQLPQLNIDRHVCKIYTPDYSFSATGVLFFFDKTTRSFMRLTTISLPAPSAAPAVQDFTGVHPSKPEIPNCNAMAYDLVYMKEYNTAQGLGIMRSHSGGDYYAFRTLNVVTSRPANPFDVFEVLPAGAKVATATVRCVNMTNSTIYSSPGNNEVYAYKVGAAVPETKILTLPEGEQVTYMEDIRTGDFKHLVVLTDTGAGWKMYCYDYAGISDELASDTPVKSYSGSGKAAHVLYRGAEGVPGF